MSARHAAAAPLRTHPPGAAVAAVATVAAAGAFTVFAAFAALAALPGRAAAQVPTLDRVDSLVAAGAYDDARATLDQWWSARETFDVPGSDPGRALMLRARLRTDPEEAISDYLQVVIGHPTSAYAPAALLRLGQGLLARGEAARAAGYLQRLAADYPGRPERTLGLLWLARAQTAARQPAAACRAARQGLADAGGSSDLAAMLSLEEAAACAIASRPAPAGQPPTAADRPAGQAAGPPPGQPSGRAGDPPDARPAEAGRFAVQTGAFRYREGADALMVRLRDAGYEPRAVLVPRNTLLRIRVGRFTSAEEAARLVARLRGAGFDAVVVGDANEERSP